MQSDLHTTLERFLLEHLMMELGNIRAGMAFLAPQPDDNSVANLGAARIDFQLSRLEDTARRMSRLLREDIEMPPILKEQRPPLREVTGDERGFGPADELIFDRDWLDGRQTGAGTMRMPDAAEPQVAAGSSGGKTLFDQQIDSLADMLCSSATPLFRSCRVEGGRVL